MGLAVIPLIPGSSSYLLQVLQVAFCPNPAITEILSLLVTLAIVSGCSQSHSILFIAEPSFALKGSAWGMAASLVDHDHLPLRVAQTAPELLCGIITEASDPSLCVFLCPKKSLTALSIDKR